MDQLCDDLTQRALNMLRERKETSSRRLLIAMAGPPGSGKSTIAAAVVARLNTSAPVAFAAQVPMDGFHLTREELGRFPQSAEAFARRGAPWTFDAHGAVTLIEQLSKPYSQKAGTIWAPSFDHATKDPVANAIPITESISLVILEGNYLLYDVPPWNRISAIVDDTWFVDVDDESVKSRIAKRHMASGIAINWNDATSRVERNDMLNGKEIISKLIKPAVRVISIDERLRSPQHPEQAGPRKSLRTVPCWREG